MIKLTIQDVDNYGNYTFIDQNQNIYVKNVNFVNIKVNKGDILYIDDYFTKELNSFTFGPYGSQYSRKEDNLIKLKKSDEEIYLERYYG